MKRVLIALTFLLALGGRAAAQVPADTRATEKPASEVVVGSGHSASKALRWSILPGGGQVYNRQAWKVPVIYAAFAGMGYAIYHNYGLMDTFRDEYLYRVNHSDTPLDPDYASYSTSNIYSLYNSYNKTFQLMIIVTAGIYALNLIDAYVFGHLFDFQIDDNLSLSVAPAWQPTPLGLMPGVGLGLRF